MVSNPFVKWSLCFFYYCFVGWIWETCYVFVCTGQWVNRGFLHGPFLPIYGFGALIILWLTIPAKGNIGMIFLLGMLGATVLEYTSGILLEQIFHTRYWNYSNMPLNLNGYICIPCSLFWGLFSIFLVKWLHGRVTHWVTSVPKALGLVVSVVLFILLSTDFVHTTEELLMAPVYYDMPESIDPPHVLFS